MSETLGQRPGSVTDAIDRWKRSRDPDALEALYGHYKQHILNMASGCLRNLKGKSQDADDIPNVVLMDLVNGFDEGNSWVITNATNRQALLGIIGRMTFLRCCKLKEYENAGVRGQVIRDADVKRAAGQDWTVFVDTANSNWEVDCRIAMDEIEEGLRELKCEYDGESLVRVFRGLRDKESIADIAAAVGASNRTVSRLKTIVRKFAAKLLDFKQDLGDNDSQADS